MAFGIGIMSAVSTGATQLVLWGNLYGAVWIDKGTEEYFQCTPHMQVREGFNLRLPLRDSRRYGKLD
jgi:hypothetical protein